MKILHNLHHQDSGHIQNIINRMYTCAAHSSIHAVVEVHIIHVLWIQAYVESSVFWGTTL